jgi:hypothetical protein
MLARIWERRFTCHVDCFSGGRALAAAKSVADTFASARAQAIRTGANLAAFFSIGGAGDTAGTALAESDGRLMPILVLNDGRPGSRKEN